MTETEIKVARDAFEQAAKLVEFRKYRRLPNPGNKGPFTIQQETLDAVITQCAAEIRALSSQVTRPYDDDDAIAREES